MDNASQGPDQGSERRSRTWPRIQLIQFGPVLGVLVVAALWRKRTRTALARSLRAGHMSAARAAALLARRS